MKKFGLGRKDKDKSDDSEDASRSRLFGSRKKKESPPPTSRSPYQQPITVPSASAGNPYAKASTPASGNPYATSATSQMKDPYAQSKEPYANPSQGMRGLQPQGDAFGRASSSSTQPPAYDAPLGSSGFRPGNEKSPVPQGGYGGGPGFNNGGRQGVPAGYGSNPYGQESSQSSSRPGGYGGLGNVQSQDDIDAGREALFGGAKERVQQQQQQQQQIQGGLPPDNRDPYTANSEEPGSLSHGYGGYADRQLTVRSTHGDNDSS